MADIKPRMDIPFFQTFLCSAFAACFDESCTIPLDIAKVRQQLQKISPAAEGSILPKYSGLLGTVLTIALEEGIVALWKASYLVYIVSSYMEV